MPPTLAGKPLLRDSLLTQALKEADCGIGHAACLLGLAERQLPPTRPCRDRPGLVSHAAFILARDMPGGAADMAERLAREIPPQEWVGQARAEGGYINLALSPAWYKAAVAEMLEASPLPVLEAPFQGRVVEGTLPVSPPAPALKLACCLAASGAVVDCDALALESVQNPVYAVWYARHRAGAPGRAPLDWCWAGAEPWLFALAAQPREAGQAQNSPERVARHLVGLAHLYLEYEAGVRRGTYPPGLHPLFDRVFDRGLTALEIDWGADTLWNQIKWGN